MKQGIEIITISKKPEEDKCPKMALLFLVAGAWGILSLCHSLEGISFPLWLADFFAAVSCWLIWYAYYSRKKIAFLLLLFYVLANIIFLFLEWKLAAEQGRHIMDCVSGKDGMEPMAVNEIMVFLAMLLSFSMAMLEFMLKNHGLLYLLTTALLLASPLWGVQSGAKTMLLLALFQLVFWAMRAAELQGKKTLLLEGGKQGLPARSGILTGGLLLLLFLAALPVVPIGLEGLYHAVYQAEGQIVRALSRASGKAAERVSGGKLGRGNNYKTGVPHLELSTDKLPAEALYLYGFQGGEYIGGDWLAANDEEIFLEILEKSKWPYGPLFSTYRSMYFEMNQASLPKGTAWPHGIGLNIIHCNGKYENRHVYSPYCGTAPQYHIYVVDKVPVSNGYGYSYYEQKDRRVDWEAIKVYNEGQIARYQALQQLYMDEIQEAYTHVPAELLPRLAQLCVENPQSTLEDITAFIIYTLHSNTSYTMTPGWTPLNEDIVEYFLFEGGMGYCEHYAAAATLMYRLYKIPARYVTGYRVPASEFQLDTLGLERLAEQTGMPADILLEAYEGYSGTTVYDVGGDTIRLNNYIEWNAVVTDEMAHAWVEIFLEDYGWTPVEVTPASDGSILAGYPGFSAESLQQNLKEHGWDVKIPSLADSASQDNIGEDGGQAPAPGTAGFGGGKKEVPAAKGFLIYFVCLLPIALECRRLLRLGRLERASCRKVFGRLLQMLQYGGYLDGYDGTEEDFAARLAAQLEEVPREEIRRLQEIVSEAAYGQEVPKSGGEEYARGMYRCLARAAYRRCRWYQKPIFRYWKGYW